VPTFYTFDETDWQRIERDWTAWWAGELERPILVLETLDPRPGVDWATYSDFLTQFALDVPVEKILDHLQLRLDAIHYFADAYPKIWINFGAGIVAAFLGSAVEYSTDTSWFKPLNARSLAEIHPAYDPKNPWWLRVQEVTRRIIARWGKRVLPSYTDLGGNLDVLASLRGTQALLTDLYDAPDEVERLTREITPLWLRYFDELDAMIQPLGRGTAHWAPHWEPGRGYMLQSDFSFMISPEMFERYVMPDLAACCEAMDYAFYHMDGKGQLRHLDMLLSLPRLRGIQWQPGTGAPLADQWPEVLKRIRDGGKLCQVFETRQGILNIMRELGGRGFLFHLSEERLTVQEAEDFMRVLEKECGAGK
jgi:hypothetical protein